METDIIDEVGIDEEGKLYLCPRSQSFLMIYREAADVHWNPKLRRLHSPVPREWTYPEWFSHIMTIAGSLRLGPETRWSNVSTERRESMEHWFKSTFQTP
jgi:hypothetical protein